MAAQNDRIIDPALSAAAAAMGRIGGPIGGRATSRKKTLAARRNGKKGGRPKKQVQP